MASGEEHAEGNIGEGKPLIPQPHGGALLPPCKPGETRNPNGRPKVGRPVSSAYADLLDTPGATVAAQIKAFRKARGRWLCGSDLIAIGMLRTSASSTNMGQVKAASEITDRTEGKVPQAHEIVAREIRDLARALEEQTGVPADEILAGAAKLGSGA